MNLKLRSIALRLFLLAFTAGMGLVSLAQPTTGPPPGGGGPAGDPPCWDPPCVPIDGGIGFLIAAGAFLGVRKLYGMYK